MSDDRRLVYSTATPNAGKAPKRKVAADSGRVPPARQTVRIRRETKGRGGKTVTVVSGIQASPEQLRVMLKDIKARVGGGGTAKDGELIIQGDHRQIVFEILEGKGFRPKLAGG